MSCTYACNLRKKMGVILRIYENASTFFLWFTESHQYYKILGEENTQQAKKTKLTAVVKPSTHSPIMIQPLPDLGKSNLHIQRVQTVATRANNLPSLRKIEKRFRVRTRQLNSPFPIKNSGTACTTFPRIRPRMPHNYCAAHLRPV